MAQKSSKLISTKEDECIMLRKCGRAVEGVGLENQSGESHRGFESLRFLQRGISSSGRASALHAEGDRFDSDILHHFLPLQSPLIMKARLGASIGFETHRDN